MWQDFWEMFIHHIATLALLVFSWTNHMHRMGSLVLLIHDFADHWLELAKLARYANFTVVFRSNFASCWIKCHFSSEMLWHLLRDILINLVLHTDWCLSYLDYLLHHYWGCSGRFQLSIYDLMHFTVQLVQMFPVYYIFNCLLSILLILHIIWFYYTCKVAYKVPLDNSKKDFSFFKLSVSYFWEDRRLTQWFWFRWWGFWWFK